MAKVSRTKIALTAFAATLALCSSHQRRSSADPLSDLGFLAVPTDTMVPTELNGNGSQTDDFAPVVDLNVTAEGAASAHIALWVPPGRAGMQPNLALDYNSRGGQSQLGLDGVSAAFQ